MKQLSLRLALLSSLVPENTRVVDVGTDHGYLAIHLAQSKALRSVIATDLRPGPLSSAHKNVEQAQLEDKISLRLCDGLAAVAPEEADVIVIAGMGGETILNILSAAPWALQDRLLLLGPQSKQPELRAWLYAHGCAIREERLVEEEGKIYPILAVEGRAAAMPEAVELYIGAWPLEKRDALFYTYLSTHIAMLEREKAGLEKSKNEGSAKRVAELDELLNALRKMEKER